MKTTVEVGELVSSLSAVGVQRQIAALPGVHHVDVNYVAGSATVHYDETRTSLEDIRRRVIDCGYHCRGEMLPAHVCPPEGHDGAHAVHAAHDHAAHGAHRSRCACRRCEHDLASRRDEGSAPCPARGTRGPRRPRRWRRARDERHDARHGPRARHVDAGHGQRHAQPLPGRAAVRDPGVPLLADGQDVRRLSAAAHAPGSGRLCVSADGVGVIQESTGVLAQARLRCHATTTGAPDDPDRRCHRLRPPSRRRAFDGADLGYSLHRLQLPGGSARFWRRGSGSPTLLVHGWEGSPSDLMAIADALHSSGRSTVLVELPAHGGSDLDWTSVPHAADALRRLGDALGPLQVLIAHSVGGAMHAAALGL